MKDSVYLIFAKGGIVAMRKTLPELRAGHYATRLKVSVDDKYFKRIIPEATMELDDKFLIEPKVNVEPMMPPEPQTHENKNAEEEQKEESQEGNQA